MSDTLNVLKRIKPLFKRGETFKCYHDFGCFASELTLIKWWGGLIFYTISYAKKRA